MAAPKIKRVKLHFEYVDFIYILLRFLTVAATFFWAYFHPELITEPTVLYFLLGFFLLYSLLFYLVLFNFPAFFKRLYLLLLVPDIIFITFLIHFTGELDSPFIYGYFLMAGLHAFYYGLYTGLIVAGVVTVADLIHLYHYLLEQPTYLGDIFMVIGFVWLLAVFGGLLGEKEIRDRKKIEQLNTELHDLYIQASMDRDRLDAILAGMADGVFAVDKKMKITLYNPAAEIITGWKAKEAVGKKCADLFQSTDKKGESICDSSVCPLNTALRKGKPISNFEHLIRTKDGKMVNISSSVAPLKGETGEIVGGVSVFRDITKIKEIEQMKTDFVSMVSHELRSPLTAIKGFAATLMREIQFDEATRRKFLGIIENESDRLTKLVEDLLSISRIEEGRLHLERTTFSLSEMIKKTFALQKEKTKKHRFVLKAPSRLPPVSADENRIRQVLENLIDNAVKFSMNGGKVTVEIKEKLHRLVVSVADQGIGLAKTDLKKIFEKFYRIDSSVTRDTGGIGLGLSIAKYIVEMHGGRIWAESKGKGQGSTFYFTLPKKIRERRQRKL